MLEEEEIERERLTPSDNQINGDTIKRAGIAPSASPVSLTSKVAAESVSILKPLRHLKLFGRSGRLGRNLVFLLWFIVVAINWGLL